MGLADTMEATSLLITPEMLQCVAALDEFKGRWNALRVLSPETLGQLRRVATVESVGSSTRIEGAKLSNREVATLLSRLSIDAFQSRDEQEVAGYAAAMNLVFDSWEAIPVNENHIKQLHRVLLEYSTKDERHRGEYKTNPNHVAAFDAGGKQIGVVFETAPPFETPLEMEKLLHWFAQAERDRYLHPLLVTGIFVVWFLAIHPFQDGNGRLSRVLTTLLLLRFGYSYVPYASLESVVEENKGAYYTALRATQQTLKTGVQNWEPWLVFFLRCLMRQRERLIRRIGAEEKTALKLSALANQNVRLYEAQTVLTVARAVELTGANRNTVKAALRTLVERQVLARRGQGRGAHYVLVAVGAAVAAA